MYTFKSLSIKNIISFENVVYEFRKGKAIIIVGENLDDSSQERNGAGKSSLIESIALCFVGTSIRDVKTKELINDKADFGEVDLQLYNTITGDTLRIWRKIYANTKSAEYRSWINNIEQDKRYSDLNTFNQFIWDTIGITKDDFFNFFLITKENYTPFLKVGDTKKKEVINRFSGADTVDNAFPLIESDSKSIQTEFTNIERELLQNQTRQQVISEQILEEENNVSEEKHKQLIKDKEEELIRLSFNQEFIENELWNAKQELKASEVAIKNFNANLITELQSFKDEVEIAELEIETFEYSEDFDKQLLDLTTSKKDINQKIITKKLELPKVKEQFKEEFDAVSLEEAELNKALKQAETELNSYEKDRGILENQLHDSIECPSCKHKFSLKDESFNYDEACKKIETLKQSIEQSKTTIASLRQQINVDIQNKNAEINQKVVKGGEKIKVTLEGYNSELVELGTKELEINKRKQVEDQNKQVLVNNLKTAQQNLTQKEREQAGKLNILIGNRSIAETVVKQKEKLLESHIESMENLNNQITTLQSQKIDRSKIEKMETDLANLIEKEIEINNRLESKRKEKESVDAWEVHFKNFKSHLANKSLKNIQDYTNMFLDNMGSNLGINIDGYKTLSNKKIKEQITTTVTRDGFDAGSYGKFSGGERARIDICNLIGMQELIMLNSGHGKGLDLLVCDEVLESVDVVGMESLINSLQSLSKTMLLVSQNEINSLAEYTMTIRKENRVSTILN